MISFTKLYDFILTVKCFTANWANWVLNWYFRGLKLC